MSGLPTGVMAALVTPLDERGNIDRSSLERMLERLLSCSLSGICPVGSTGEGPLLDRDSRSQMTSIVSSLLPQGVWNIPAVISNTLGDALADIETYAGAGAHAVLVTAPFYYQHSPFAVAKWYETVAERSSLPILVYNIPSFTKISVSPDVVASLARDSRVIGMKDSSRDLEYFETILDVTRGMPFSLLTGSDTLLLASGILGGSGTIAASVNLVPEIVTALWNAILAQEWQTARELQTELMAIVSVCRRAGFPSGWKAALYLLGLCSANAVFPNPTLSGASLESLAMELESVGVVMKKDVQW
ncbi:MAG: dihydrodipicolinate synthase family protein [Actinomycetota bacterium]|nr:dihydrodipicolinate synthase family protein [Actinomycetota bacterium]